MTVSKMTIFRNLTQNQNKTHLKRDVPMSFERKLFRPSSAQGKTVRRLEGKRVPAGDWRNGPMSQRNLDRFWAGYRATDGYKKSAVRHSMSSAGRAQTKASRGTSLYRSRNGKGSRSARGKSKGARKGRSRYAKVTRSGVTKQIRDMLAPRNELITQFAGQVRTAGVGITAQGNQNVLVLQPAISVADIQTIITQLSAQQGSGAGTGTVGWSGAAYDGIKLDFVQGKRTRHEYEFVNNGNQDVHFRIWWFKAKIDIVENEEWQTLAQFITYATSTTLATALSRGGTSFTGTYTNVTNPWHIVGWHPNMVPNGYFKHFFKIKPGPESLMAPGAHKKLRVPVGKGARYTDVTDFALITTITAAQGKLLYPKGTLIPVLVTYGDIVHGTEAKAQTTTVSTGSVTLDYIRKGWHYWQAVPRVPPQQYFEASGFNQATDIGAGVALSQAGGQPTAYDADA